MSNDSRERQQRVPLALMMLLSVMCVTSGLLWPFEKLHAIVVVGAMAVALLPYVYAWPEIRAAKRRSGSWLKLPITRLNVPVFWLLMMLGMTLPGMQEIYGKSPALLAAYVLGALALAVVAVRASRPRKQTV